MAGIVAERQPERWEATLVWDGEGRGERRGRSFHLGISILQNEVLLAFLPFIRRPGRQRQEDLKTRASLGYTLRFSSPAYSLSSLSA